MDTGVVAPTDFEQVLAGERVLVTGHTGFTGGWLSLWLHAIGCKVAGLALVPNTEPSLFIAANLAGILDSSIGDIRDYVVVEQTISRVKPSVIFHLAAQPLVSVSFDEPIETYATNVMGTAHVLEAARRSKSVKAVVCVTTDKVYAGNDGQRGFRETDQLGGKDPYAASKVCAEFVAMSYRATMAERGNGVLIATARGGNIIGGGDWSKDRIVPDFVRAVTSNKPLTVRNPAAVRPWQHVMALVHGYLMLASRMLEGRAAVADNWNFGPVEADTVPVQLLVDRLGAGWKQPAIERKQGAFPETHFLHLDSTKARNELDWRPVLDLDGALRLTAQWYRDYYMHPSSARALTINQIEGYRGLL